MSDAPQKKTASKLPESLVKLASSFQLTVGFHGLFRRTAFSPICFFEGFLCIDFELIASDRGYLHRQSFVRCGLASIDEDQRASELWSGAEFLMLELNELALARSVFEESSDEFDVEVGVETPRLHVVELVLNAKESEQSGVVRVKLPTAAKASVVPIVNEAQQYDAAFESREIMFD